MISFAGSRLRFLAEGMAAIRRSLGSATPPNGAKVRRIFPAVLLAAGLLGLTGCWDMLAVEDLGFVNLVYLDRLPNGRVVARIQVTNPSSLPTPGGGNPSGSGGGAGGGTSQAATPVYQIYGTGLNVAQALRAADLASINRLYTGHIQVLLVGEHEARTDLAEALDFFERNPKSRTIQWVYIVEPADVNRILGQLTVPSTGYPANAISNFSLHMESASNLRPVRLYQLTDVLATPERDVAIPILTLTTPARIYTIKGMALFRGPHWVGTLSVPDAAGLTWLRHQIRFQDFTVPCPFHPAQPSADLTLQTMGATLKAHPLFNTNRAGQRLLKSIDVHLFAMVRVSESPPACPVSYEKPRQHDAVSQMAAQTVLTVVSTSIEKAKRIGSDPFGFGTYVRIADPALWTRIGPSWANQIFPAVPITLHVRIRLDDTGGLYRPL